MMFIDPHLDTSDVQYRDFLPLLANAGGRTPQPLIELHRAAWYGGGHDKRPRVAEVEAALTPSLLACAKQTGLKFEVFLWNDVHDRYLIRACCTVSEA
jgi:hypothetical protein